jgi:hypothetical protein
MENTPKIGQGHPAFHAVLKRIGEIHNKKSTDYGTDEDLFKNYRSEEEFGVPDWINVMLRANDKFQRIKTFCKKRELANESVEDSFIDLAAHAIIALVIYQEQKDKSN